MHARTHARTHASPPPSPRARTLISALSAASSCRRCCSCSRRSCCRRSSSSRARCARRSFSTSARSPNPGYVVGGGRARGRQAVTDTQAHERWCTDCLLVCTFASHTQHTCAIKAPSPDCLDQSCRRHPPHPHPPRHHHHHHHHRRLQSQTLARVHRFPSAA